MGSLQATCVFVAVTAPRLTLAERFTAHLCSSSAEDLHPLECGMSVVTCFRGTDPDTRVADLGGHVVGGIDARGSLMTNASVRAPVYDRPAWFGNDLGQVLGVALDAARPPNIHEFYESCFPVKKVPGPLRSR